MENPILIMLLRLIPVGEVPAFVMNSIKDEMEGLGLECRMMEKIALPKEAYHSGRGQYNGQTLIEVALKNSEAEFIDSSMPTLLITYADMYFGNSSFIFGLEYPAKSCAIISLFRLRTEFYGERPVSSTLADRAVKEAVHELGHHIGMEHCKNNRCVMSFSSSASDIDKKGKDFCDACKLEMMTRGIGFDSK